MCPDGETLSAYLDGEIEEPWSRTIHKHIESCGQCRQRLQTLQRINHILLEDSSPDYLESMEKVKRRIQITQVAENSARVSFWKRKVTFPIPVAVAAIAAIVFFGFYFLLIQPGRSSMRLVKIKTEPSGSTEVQVAAPIEDIEQLLKSLDKNQFRREVIIQLPVDSKFSFIGKPAIMRETEFIRGK